MDITALLYDFSVFIWSVIYNWLSIIYGFAVATAMSLYKLKSGKGMPTWVIEAALVLFLLLAGFKVWQEQYHEVQRLKENLSPKLEIVDLSKSEIEGLLTTVKYKNDYKRSGFEIIIGVKNISDTTVKNVEARVEKINKIVNNKLAKPMSNAKSININPGQTKVFSIATFLYKDDKYPAYLHIGNFTTASDDKYVCILSVSGENVGAVKYKVSLQIPENGFDGDITFFNLVDFELIGKIKNE